MLVVDRSPAVLIWTATHDRMEWRNLQFTRVRCFCGMPNDERLL